MTKTHKRRTSRKRRSRQEKSSGLLAKISPAVWIVGGSVFILAFGVSFSLWQAGAVAGPVELSRSEGPGELLPLAETGSPLYGEHDMELIPQQTPAPSSAPLDEPTPQVDIPNTQHDFGRVPSRRDVAHVFEIQNMGNDDLVISNLVTSCGCTTAELTSNVIPPGERADLTVYFDPNYHQTRGEVVRLVWFATNDPTYPWAEVRLTANVVP